MPVNPLIYEVPSDNIQNTFKSSITSFSSISKNKLDKAQARRLKMPKRNRSAYFLFSMDIRAKLKAEPKNQLTPLETQALVSRYWKDLSAEEKEKYEQRAKEEKLEYLTAMDKFYSNLTPETIEKSKTNKPKKPCSAYAHFVRDIKIDLKRENPRLIMQDILHIASDKWKNLSEEVRAVYEEKARKDKEQYMTIIRNFNSNETQESPKRRKGSQVSVKLGKRSCQSEAFDKEEKLNKQVKVESFSVKSETPIELEGSSYIQMKFEESKETSSISMSPINNYIDPDYHQQIVEKIRGGLMHMSEQSMVPLKINPWNEEQNTFEMPRLNGYFAQSMLNSTNMDHYMLKNIQNYQQTKQAIAAKLSFSRMMQNHQNLEQSIVRKMMEIKTLQAQRLMFRREFFLATANTGRF